MEIHRKLETGHSMRFVLIRAIRVKWFDWTEGLRLSKTTL